MIVIGDQSCSREEWKKELGLRARALGSLLCREFGQLEELLPSARIAAWDSEHDRAHALVEKLMLLTQDEVLDFYTPRQIVTRAMEVLAEMDQLRVVLSCCVTDQIRRRRQLGLDPSFGPQALREELPN